MTRISNQNDNPSLDLFPTRNFLHSESNSVFRSDRKYLVNIDFSAIISPFGEHSDIGL